MNDVFRRFLFIAIACVVAYVLLHVLRSFAVEPEARGLWAGATGYMVGDLFAGPGRIGARRKRRS